jgi:hypothetical protein
MDLEPRTLRRVSQVPLPFPVVSHFVACLERLDLGFASRPVNRHLRDALPLRRWHHSPASCKPGAGLLSLSRSSFSRAWM